MKDDRQKPAAPSCDLKYEHGKRSLVENPDGVFILHSSKEEARQLPRSLEGLVSLCRT